MERVLEAIGAGRVVKVVLARTLDVRPRVDIDPITVLGHLWEANRGTHVFFFEPRPGRVVLGAAPETIATLRHGMFHATAVAGSIRPGASEEERAGLADSLLSSGKDRAEHRIAVDDMLERLDEVTEGVHAEPEPHVLALPSIQHLESEIRARVRGGTGVLEVLAALPPHASRMRVPPRSGAGTACPGGGVRARLVRRAGGLVRPRGQRRVRPRTTERRVVRGELAPFRGCRDRGGIGPGRRVDGDGDQAGYCAAGSWGGVPAVSGLDRNSIWAGAFADELARAGVREVCLAPGSRSTPLVLAFARHGGFRLRVHLDERSAGFFALGTGKTSGVPAVVLTTSGTAAANLFPAVIEASQGETPLLVLTADRPHRMRGGDANQTIDQLRLFGPFVHEFFEVAPPRLKAPHSATSAPSLDVPWPARWVRPRGPCT